jgi:hypothetical protein
VVDSLPTIYRAQSDQGRCMSKHRYYIYANRLTQDEHLGPLCDNSDILSSKYCIALTKFNL